MAQAEEVYIVAHSADPLVSSLIGHADKCNIKICLLIPYDVSAKFCLEDFADNELYRADIRFVFRDCALPLRETDDERFIDDKQYAFLWGLAGIAGKRSFNGASHLGLISCALGEDAPDAVLPKDNWEAPSYVSSLRCLPIQFDECAWSRNLQIGDVRRIQEASTDVPLRIILSCQEPYYEQVYVVAGSCWFRSLHVADAIFGSMRQASVDIANILRFDFCEVTWRISGIAQEAHPVRIDPHACPHYSSEEVFSAIWNLVIA